MIKQYELSEYSSNVDWRKIAGNGIDLSKTKFASNTVEIENYEVITKRMVNEKWLFYNIQSVLIDFKLNQLSEIHQLNFQIIIIVCHPSKNKLKKGQVTSLAFLLKICYQPRSNNFQDSRSLSKYQNPFPNHQKM